MVWVDSSFLRFSFSTFPGVFNVFIQLLSKATLISHARSVGLPAMQMLSIIHLKGECLDSGCIYGYTTGLAPVL